MTNTNIDEFGTKRWRKKNGHLHREDGPAIIFSSGCQMWYINNELHRENGPAIIYEDNDDHSYFLNDIQYTEDAYKMIQFFNGVNVNA